MEFFIDTEGDNKLQFKTELLEETEYPFSLDHHKSDRIVELFEKKKQELDTEAINEAEVEKKLSRMKIDNLFDDFFNDMGWSDCIIIKKERKKKIFHFDQLDLDTGKLKSKLGAIDVAKELEKSVLQPGIEKEHNLPPYNLSEKKLKALRREERKKTKGPEWFNMPAPEMTSELKNDLNILKMRAALDPKHFYKKNDMEVLPKYFQVGRIMDSPLDHVNERLTRKERKRTMVDELLADAEFQKYSKKKYKEIIDEKKKKDYRAHMRDKRQKSKAIAKKNKMSNKNASINKK
ncbi:Deoxynucleotidyltransferase terminal-interacting protein 2 [Eumeta japonica]|uniref:Deoxynucleotidyltransferase terminal-interacting protein 2 n=1 Tax=Eumeta variegata TaxID=151549 RepID=A0A4C1UMU6_EUMVA|nr:Deoxynucleotidyltransferase terminal-interacting protein 2 [Eumeta japonica]